MIIFMIDRVPTTLCEVMEHQCLQMLMHQEINVAPAEIGIPI